MTRADGSVSFYFFDFDDNAMVLPTPILLRNRDTGEDKAVTTGEFAKIRPFLGSDGPWRDFELFDQSFRRFRDRPTEGGEPPAKEYFVEDIERALDGHPASWQAPSWPLLVYACEKQRPVAFVTARGHSRETFRKGVRVMVEKRLLPREPNYLAIYAVGHPDTALELLKGADAQERARLQALDDRTSALKRLAINAIVDLALETYGAEPEHRFGMSDDDPENVDLIIKAMCDCKKKHMDKRFFVINTHHGEPVKLEVFPVDHPVTGRADTDDAIG